MAHDISTRGFSYRVLYTGNRRRPCLSNVYGVGLSAYIIKGQRRSRVFCVRAPLLLHIRQSPICFPGKYFSSLSNTTTAIPPLLIFLSFTPPSFVPAITHALNLTPRPYANKYKHQRFSNTQREEANKRYIYPLSYCGLMHYKYHFSAEWDLKAFLPVLYTLAWKTVAWYILQNIIGFKRRFLLLSLAVLHD